MRVRPGLCARCGAQDAGCSNDSFEELRDCRAGEMRENLSTGAESGRYT